MSHFSTIRTKLKDKSILLEALDLMKERVNNPEDLGMSVVDLVITNPDHAEEHPTAEVDFSLGVDYGFRLNKDTGTYELVADRQTWDKDIPIERFLEKVTQQYARMTIHRTVKEQGFEVEHEWEMDDNSIELTVSRWVE
tara:strand:+ start:1318 stop:1734 length:417 start_codon:yes stop_codon:yes gene_type:complete